LLAALGFAADARGQLAEAAREAAGEPELRAEIDRAAQDPPVDTSAQ
jgi:hypothetical protein